MILDELEQERCNKSLFTINTKCTFGWPGLVEDPGSGEGAGVTLYIRVLACNFAVSYMFFCLCFFPNLHFLLVVLAQTELFMKEMNTFLFSSVAYALYSVDMLHVFPSDITRESRS